MTITMRKDTKTPDSMQSEVFRTKDYNKFKFVESNRPIHPKHLENLKHDIEFNNLLAEFPLVVNPGFEILDGQHRFRAAQDLGLEIYYIISDKMRVQDVPKANQSNRKWLSEDFVHFYAENGYAEYIKFLDFQRKYKVSFSDLETFFITSSKLRMKALKEGKFVFALDEETFKEDFLKLKTLIQSIKDYLGSPAWIQSRAWKRAIWNIIMDESINFDYLMKKLPFKVKLFRPIGRVQDGVEILKEIHNFQRRSKSSQDDLG